MDSICKHVSLDVSWYVKTIEFNFIEKHCFILVVCCLLKLNAVTIILSRVWSLLGRHTEGQHVVLFMADMKPFIILLVFSIGALQWSMAITPEKVSEVIETIITQMEVDSVPITRTCELLVNKPLLEETKLSTSSRATVRINFKDFSRGRKNGKNPEKASNARFNW